MVAFARRWRRQWALDLLYCRSAQATNAIIATRAINDRLTKSVSSSFLRGMNSSLSRRLRWADVAHAATGQWLKMAASRYTPLADDDHIPPCRCLLNRRAEAAMLGGVRQELAAGISESDNPALHAVRCSPSAKLIRLSEALR
jgi:hypothetical protein